LDASTTSGVVITKNMPQTLPDVLWRTKLPLIKKYYLNPMKRLEILTLGLDLDEEARKPTE